jgi:hypothetical protein
MQSFGMLKQLVPLGSKELMYSEQLLEWELAGETRVLGGNLPQCHFCHQKSRKT